MDCRPVYPPTRKARREKENSDVDTDVIICCCWQHGGNGAKENVVDPYRHTKYPIPLYSSFCFPAVAAKPAWKSLATLLVISTVISKGIRKNGV